MKMLPKAIHDLVHRKWKNNESYMKIATDLHLKIATVVSICSRKGKIKKKTGIKPKVNDRTSRLIKKTSQRMLDNGDKITSNFIIKQCNLSLSKSAVQRFHHQNNYVYKNVRKQIIFWQKIKKLEEKNFVQNGWEIG